MNTTRDIDVAIPSVTKNRPTKLTALVDTRFVCDNWRSCVIC